ncbi:MAG: hypothetical protein ACXWX7_07900 [Candidatus Binatia bacterium]
MRNKWAKKSGSYSALSGSGNRSLCKNEQFMDKIVQNRQLFNGMFVIELSQRFASEGRLEGKNGGSVLSFLDVIMWPQYPEGANYHSSRGVQAMTIGNSEVWKSMQRLGGR